MDSNGPDEEKDGVMWTNQNTAALFAAQVAACLSTPGGGGTTNSLVESPVVTRESKPVPSANMPARDVKPLSTVAQREPVPVSVESINSPSRTSTSNSSDSLSSGTDTESPVREVTPDVNCVPPTHVKNDATPPIEKPVPVSQPPVPEPVKEINDAPKKERAKKKAKDYVKKDIKDTRMDAFTDSKMAGHLKPQASDVWSPLLKVQY